MERGILYTDSSRGLYLIVLDGPYNSSLPNRSEVRGYVCRACHKIVLEY